MKEYNRTFAKIDLDAIESNYDNLYKNVHGNGKLIGVIKADGYGHGSVEIAEILENKDYLWGFAVATLDEAIVLRKAGVKKPILVLGYVFGDQLEDAIANDIRLTCYMKSHAEAISDIATRLNKKAYIHIKIDTGMGRIGFLVNEENADTIVTISKLPNISIEGMFTHFAKADETDKTFTNNQMKKYGQMKEWLDKRGLKLQYYHEANSAGIIDVYESHLDLLRAGIAGYGLYPSEEVHKENVSLIPALSWYSHVIFVKEVEAGTTVSYGATFTADKHMKIATIPVGYADGYPRSLSNKGFVLIHGKKCKILGRVCMDQFMVDVTDLEQIKVGDEVDLVGDSEGTHLAASELSDLSGRFNYEFVCDISKRVPRVYYRHGKRVKEKDWFY
ncbi:MAG: alanine racemase [Lachnospiraceae bacterium]|nr:alanine racemase [Lachnospiraceae bacterium]